MKYIVYILVCAVVSRTSFAYNYERCNRYLQVRYYDPWSDMFTSSSQFISSTGECALIGDRAKEIEEFFYLNYDILKIEASRGTGERLSAFNKLLSCDDEHGKRLDKYFQKNYLTLFQEEVQKKMNAKELYSDIREKLLVDKRDFYTCVF